MRKYYFISIILLSFTSQISSQNWFPLEDGNIWQIEREIYWNMPWPHYSLEIISYDSILDTIINGREYFRLDDSFLFGLNNLYHYNNLDNKIYIRYQDSDYVHMDFNLTAGEEFLHMNKLNELVTVVVEEGQYNLLDSTLNFKGFDDGYWYYWFAEGIGLIRERSSSSGSWASNDIIQAILYDTLGFRVVQDKTLPYAQLDSNYTLRDLNTLFTVYINHKFSALSSNTVGSTVYGDTYIDSARIETYYQKGNTTIFSGEYRMVPLNEIKFAKFINLDPTLIFSHYDFCYRIWAKDRGLVQREAFTPDTGLAKVKYRTRFTDYYPLHRFNRWVYDRYELYPNGDSSYTGTFGYWIGKDTLLADGKIYKPFISILNNSTHFERIDSVNAVIHKVFEQGTNKVIDSLTASIGDTVLASRLSYSDKVIFESSIMDNSFGIWSWAQKYQSVNDPESYYRIKDERGLMELREAPTDSTNGILLRLKGVIIKFFVYGDTTITSVKQDEIIAQTFALHQNYPNPFNPTTIISYNLPEALKTKLTIYDILGNKVAVLVDEEQNAGYYEIEFDGKNLASGIYLYKLNAVKFSESKKMILIR